MELGNSKYNLDNYVLKITEKYMRYYYSAEAQILKNETTEYEISKGLQIFFHPDKKSVASSLLSRFFCFATQ